ncbi:MAG: formate--tetrahydrofolate ligase [Kiritimatiellia bacterium]|jgi:formate--tetrahydrofolate ligase
MRPISDVANELGLDPEHLIMYGKHKAKVHLDAMNTPRRGTQPGRLVLVSALTPTPAGEGKTTTTVGLGQAMRSLGESVCVALREPSLGPCFGIKGGGAGGGNCNVEPAIDINLHFNGDFHAISSAHNLLAAAIDNHLHFGNKLRFDIRRLLWPRVMDMNDRSLRSIMVGMGGRTGGIPRETGFDITAASEVMAILCLSEDIDDLRRRLDNTLVGFSMEREPIYARQLEVTGAMVALLRDAMNPNLVQTTDGTPAFVHGGPFANIAHGCNSIIATRMAMHHADWTITEAGFGFDLGAEKFFDIKCRQAGLDTVCVVLVATVRALKMHGGVSLKELGGDNPEAVLRGLPNLARHLDSIQNFGEKAVVAINRFANDSDAEIETVRAWCEEREVPVAMCTHYADGAAGAVDLAQAVLATAEWNSSPFTPTYELDQPIVDKIRNIVQKVYGGDDVILTADAKRDLGLIKRLGLTDLPICMAKTQNSVSDNPKLRGRPEGFDITVRRIRINTGAGFLVVLTGDIMRMPGLPRRPAAADIDVVDGQIVGMS